MKQINCCPKCGGELELIDEMYQCKFCNSVFDVEKTDDIEEKMRGLLDETKQEEVANLRRKLWDAIHEKHLSKKKIGDLADELYKYIPDDFLVNFYYTVCNKNADDINEFLNDIDVKENYHLMDIVIETMIGCLEEKHLLTVNNLIEKTYKSRDLVTYEKYATMLSKVADKIKEGIYDIELSRDVFVAYSSKDMKIVEEVTNALEKEGISCFVAMRNLRHGLGSADNYDLALKKAIDNCKIFLFISTPNSRSRECDALKIEIPYVKQKDILNAPPEYKNYYNKIPAKYKKARIQLLIGSQPGTGPADQRVNEFYSGCEWVYTAENAVAQAYKILDEGIMEVEEPVRVVAEAPVATDSNEKLLKRCEILIEDRDYTKASKLIDDILNNDPECSRAYLYATLIDLDLNKLDDLKTQIKPLEENRNFAKALKFAKGYEVRELNNYVAKVRENVSAKQEDIYNSGLKYKNEGKYKLAIEVFTKLNDFKDSRQQVVSCENLLLQQKDSNLNKAKDLIRMYKYDEAIIILENLKGHRDSSALLESTRILKEKENTYQSAILLAKYSDYESIDSAAKKMDSIAGYRDSSSLAKVYHEKASKIHRKNEVTAANYNRPYTPKKRFRFSMLLLLLIPYVGIIIFIVMAARGKLFKYK